MQSKTWGRHYSLLNINLEQNSDKSSLYSVFAINSAEVSASFLADPLVCCQSRPPLELINSGVPFDIGVEISLDRVQLLVDEKLLVDQALAVPGLVREFAQVVFCEFRSFQ